MAGRSWRGQWAWRRAPLEQIQADALIARCWKRAVAVASPEGWSLGKSGGGAQHHQRSCLHLSKVCGCILLALMVRNREPRGQPASSDSTGCMWPMVALRVTSSLEACVLPPPYKALCLIYDPAQNSPFEHRSQLEGAQDGQI